jgi:hypothetical protein
MLGDRGTTYPLYFAKEQSIRDITEVSPVARALDTSFNETAQQVRVYCHPDFRGKITEAAALEALSQSLA